MNDHDRNNLNFILGLSVDEMTAFFADKSEDDIDYAIELLRTARSELQLESLDCIEEDIDENCTDAKNVLKKFML